jgi:serine/threonine protein kinase/Flp pilus assembly protein TadD
MTPARFQTVEEIYRAALDQEPDQVGAFLDTACEGDELLRRKIEALLASRERAGSFIETSAVHIATRVIETGQADLLVGQTFGHYKISKRIGTGGMGEVYLAADVMAGRKAALKLLPMRFTGDAERLKRFQQEARAVVALNHPNILTVYEIGQDHSTHYIASELIEGETLRQRLERERLQVSEAVDVAIQVASALAVAHEAGIVHRDIKPENVMVRRDGYVKVLDFGVAKLAESALAEATADGAESMTLVETNLGSILGTVRYMSPEQTCGATVDKRTDIWSLGVVLYEMVTGHTPFTGDTPGEVMTSIFDKEQPPLTTYIKQTPAEVQQIISKALRKDRSERYQSAAEMREALKNLRRKLEFKAELDRTTMLPLWLRWARSPVALVLLALVSALALALPFYRHRNQATILPPDKSIAVLPLENLSDEKDNAFFAAGIHDELLSNLSKIKDLKVISRTSVMQYKSGNPRNLREIGQQLGVAHVMEGSVQRTANRVKVSAQLIDARTDAHLWSQTYDRDLTDVFAIQSEIARTIADQLQAKLSPAENAAIAERPTADPVAYALYTEATAIASRGDWEGWDKNGSRAVELFEKATQRDPNFALAYCGLANAQGRLYHWTRDPQRLELAKKAAETALRLRPDLGETHLALASYYFSTGFSPADGRQGGIHTTGFDRAREELAIARLKLPNNAEAIFRTGRIDRRQNRWDSALANFQKANELDPRNGGLARALGVAYFELRRYSDLEQLMKKCAASGVIEEANIQHSIAQMKLAQGDPVAAQSVLEQVPLDFSQHPFIWQTRFDVALCLRDYDAVSRVIAATPAKWATQGIFGSGQPPESWADGQVALARGDKEKALAVFAAARKKLDATWGDKPKDEEYYRQAAVLDAELGRKEDAIREALHAIELMPIAKDSIAGPQLVINLALVYAWTGERDRALEQLEIVATIPAGATYGDLRFNPCWDSLRGDPRFDKIVAAAKAASR